MTHLGSLTDAELSQATQVGLSAAQAQQAKDLHRSLSDFRDTLVSSGVIEDTDTAKPTFRNIDGVPFIVNPDGTLSPAGIRIPTETTQTFEAGEGEDVATGTETVSGSTVVPADQFLASTGGGGGGASFSVSDVGPVSAGLQQQRIEQDADRLVFDILREANAVGNDAASLELQRDQLALAGRQGDRDAAIRLAQLAEQTNSRLDQRQLTLASLKQNAQIARAQITSSEQQASLDRAVQIAGLAENARQFNAQERRLLASEIADAAARPGDVVKQEALIQAAGQAGSGSPISTSIAQGESAITDASLLPLQMLLDAQGQLGGTESQLGQALANILGQAGSGAAGMIGDPNVQFGAGVTPPPLPVAPPPPLPAAALPAPQTGVQLAQAALATDPTVPESPERVAFREHLQSLSGQELLDAIDIESGLTAQARVPTADKGGVFNIAEVHDDELVIDMPGEGFAVIPKEELENAPKAQEGGVFSLPAVDDPTKDINPTITRANVGRTGLTVDPALTEQARALAGGRTFFGGADTQTAATAAPSTGLFTNFGDLSNTSGAQSFISDALQRVFGRVAESGLQLPSAITPVAASTPGTSLGLQQLMAAIASARSGISPESFLAEAQAIRPRGVPGLLPARRTA